MLSHLPANAGSTVPIQTAPMPWAGQWTMPQWRRETGSWSAWEQPNRQSTLASLKLLPSQALSRRGSVLTQTPHKEQLQPQGLPTQSLGSRASNSTQQIPIALQPPPSGSYMGKVRQRHRLLHQSSEANNNRLWRHHTLQWLQLEVLTTLLVFMIKSQEQTWLTRTLQPVLSCKAVSRIQATCLNKPRNKRDSKNLYSNYLSRIEKDVFSLRNRVRLLEIEHKRAVKKISEANQRATHMADLKYKND